MMPKEIEENKEAQALFIKTILSLEEAQAELARIFKIDEIKDFSKKKKLTSTFRRIAPIGLATGIVATFNLRALRWCIQLRTSIQAEVEMRKVFNQVFKIVSSKYPMIFQDFEPWSTFRITRLGLDETDEVEKTFDRLRPFYFADGKAEVSSRGKDELVGVMPTNKLALLKQEIDNMEGSPIKVEDISDRIYEYRPQSRKV
jgi:thymidylate synthase ThyX